MCASLSSLYFYLSDFQCSIPNGCRSRKGPLMPADRALVEQQYLAYREDYNRPLPDDDFCDFLGL